MHGQGVGVERRELCLSTYEKFFTEQQDAGGARLVRDCGVGQGEVREVEDRAPGTAFESCSEYYFNL